MSELLRLRRAECGHWIPADLPAAGNYDGNGAHSPQPVYLCAQCEQLARSHLKPKIEAKAVSAGQLGRWKHEWQSRDLGIDLIAEAAPSAVEPAADEPELTAYEKGRLAAQFNASEEDLPYPDRRTKDAKEWLRGYREAKADVSEGGQATSGQRA